MNFLQTIIVLTVIIVPVITHAQVTTPTTFAGLVNLLLDFFELLIPVVFAILFLYIVWKILDAWVINATDESKRAEGRQVALIGVVGMIVMLIAWGLVNIIRATFLG